MKLSYLSLYIAVIAASPSSCVVVDGSSSSSTCCAFISIPFLGLNQANPEITQHAIAQESTLLKINLDIAQEVNLKNRQQVLSGDRLGIEGLTIKLKGREDANYKQWDRDNLGFEMSENGPDSFLLSNISDIYIFHTHTYSVPTCQVPTDPILNYHREPKRYIYSKRANSWILRALEKLTLRMARGK